MKKYVICTANGDAFNAASKARRDAETIAVCEGYEPFLFRGARTANGSVFGAVRLVWAGLSNWARLIRTAEKGSVILVQYPHYPQKSMRLFPKMLALSKRKGLKWIALVHDLDSLRGYHGSAAAYADRNVLSLFDMVICHNDSMRELLAGWGFRSEQLISLGLFDYLTEETGFREAKGIAIAGNLSSEKCGYIQALIAQGRPNLHLYGKGLENGKLPEHIVYHGAFSPEELPGKLEGQYGLVWDGAEITECAGKQGEYLRINNPHKVSLYLAAGMPVILWKQAALAKLVEEQGIGLVTESLKDLDQKIQAISTEDYARMCGQAKRLGARIREGWFLKQALKQAEDRLEGKRTE